MEVFEFGKCGMRNGGVKEGEGRWMRDEGREEVKKVRSCEVRKLGCYEKLDAQVPILPSSQIPSIPASQLPGHIIGITQSTH